MSAFRSNRQLGSTLISTLIAVGMGAVVIAAVTNTLIDNFQVAQLIEDRSALASSRLKIMKQIDCQSTLGVLNGALTECNGQPIKLYGIGLGGQGAVIASQPGTGDLATSYLLQDDWYIRATCLPNTGLLVSVAKGSNGKFVRASYGTKPLMSFSSNWNMSIGQSSVPLNPIFGGDNDFQLCDSYFNSGNNIISSRDVACDHDGLNNNDSLVNHLSFDPGTSQFMDLGCERVSDVNVGLIQVTGPSIKNSDLKGELVPSGQIASNEIKDFEFSTRHFKNDIVRSNHIQNGAINITNADRLAVNSVDTTEIHDGDILSSHVKDDSLISRLFAKNSIATDDLSPIAGDDEFAKNAIITEKIHNDSIGGSDFLDDAIKHAKIAINNIITDTFAAFTVKSEDIGNYQINGNHIMSDPNHVTSAISTRHIVNGAITNDLIGDNQINSSAKIIDGSITADDLDIDCPNQGDFLTWGTLTAGTTPPGAGMGWICTKTPKVQVAIGYIELKRDASTGSPPPSFDTTVHSVEVTNGSNINDVMDYENTGWYVDSTFQGIKCKNGWLAVSCSSYTSMGPITSAKIRAHKAWFDGGNKNDWTKLPDDAYFWFDDDVFLKSESNTCRTNDFGDFVNGGEDSKMKGAWYRMFAVCMKIE